MVARAEEACREVLTVLPAASPTLLADKSALQGLSPDEARVLGRYFTLVVPPVLWSELMGDVAKALGSSTPEKRQRYRASLQAVAQRIRTFDIRLCASRTDLTLTSLVRGLPTLPMREPLTVARSGRGGGRPPSVALWDVPPRMFFDWSQGRVDPRDIEGGHEWLRQQDDWDQEAFHKRLRADVIRRWRNPTPDELLAAIDKTMMEPDSQRTMLEEDVRISRMDRGREQRLWSRWWSVPGAQRLYPIFAPFAAHVRRVREFANLALAHDLVTPRRTNPIDREYLMYLPFCTVVAAEDKYLQTLGQPLLKPDQLFMTIRHLKREAEILDGLAKEQHAGVAAGHPPPEGTRFTGDAWTMHFGPRDRWPRRVEPERLHGLKLHPS